MPGSRDRSTRPPRACRGLLDGMLDGIVARAGADELMASTSAYDRADLLASDASLRSLVG